MHSISLTLAQTQEVPDIYCLLSELEGQILVSVENWRVAGLDDLNALQGGARCGTFHDRYDLILWQNPVKEGVFIFKVNNQLFRHTSGDDLPECDGDRLLGVECFKS